jgi:hypothetical protein
MVVPSRRRQRSRLLQAFFPEQKALIMPPDSLPLDGRHNPHELWLFVANGSSGGFNAIAFAGLGIEANALQNGVGIGIAFDLKEFRREDS